MPAPRQCLALLALLALPARAAAAGGADVGPRRVARSIRGFAEPGSAEEAAARAGGWRADARRRLQVKDGWMINNVQSSLEDGAPGKHAYFDEATVPGFEFGDGETEADVKQYRNGELIWEGVAVLLRSTEGMVGTCGMEFCTARIRRKVNVAAGQWQVGDVIVVKGFHDVVDLDIVIPVDKEELEEKEKKAEPPVAMIMVIVVACLIGLCCCALVGWLCRSRRAPPQARELQEREDDRLAPAIAAAPPAPAPPPAVAPPPKVREPVAREENRQGIPASGGGKAAAIGDAGPQEEEEAAQEEPAVEDVIQPETSQEEEAQATDKPPAKFSWQDYYGNNV